MNKTVCFALGVTVGALGAWYACKEHYKKLADEEIQSVIDAFRDKTASDETAVKDETAPDPEQQAYEKERASKLQNYRALIRESGYLARTSPKELLEDDPDAPTPGDEIPKPYVIKPEEFDTLDDYDAVCYTYYADGVLVDEDEDPLEIDEIASSIGLNYASHFGDYEDDSVHIRNDLRKIDYEVIRDLRKYGDFHDTE